MDDHLDMIDVYNPTDRDFTHPWGGTPHTIPAGEHKVLQRFLAEHLCKHLIDREIQSAKKKLNDENLRKEWEDKIIVGVFQKFSEDKPLTEGEKVARQNEIINEQQEERFKKLEEDNERIRKAVSGSGLKGKRKPGRPRKTTGTGTGKEATPPSESAEISK